MATRCAFLPANSNGNVHYLCRLGQDGHPVYVPFGDQPLAVAQRQTLALALSAMDCVVLAILPLSYLFRRIPRIAWGVSFGTLGLISVFHVGFFTKNLLPAPILLSQPMYARAPLMDVLPDHFVFSTSPRPTEIDSGAARSSYMGKVLFTSVRVASASTVILQYGEQSAILNIANDATGRMAATGVIAMVHIMPGEFQKGIPQSLNLNLAIIEPCCSASSTL